MQNFNLRILSLNELAEACRFFCRYIHPTEYGSSYMAAKAGYYNVYGENLRDPAVQILKETLLSCGGELVTNRDVLIHQTGTSAVVMMATKAQFQFAIKRLKLQQFGLPQLAEELTALLNDVGLRKERVLPYRGGELVFGKKTLVMGILNCTPDSFSDGGKWNHLDEALRHTEAMIADGADIIDIGGESTRPGHTPVSAEEEAQRVLPVIEAVRKRFDIPISVDTFKSSVAESAIQAGADLVNDIWGLKYDSEMGAVIAKYDVACCLMHNKSNTEYNNFLIDMLSETQECVNLARKAGIKDEKIILDPGVGFGKTFEMNLETMNHLELFKNLGFPVLLGTSRKSMIGLALDLPVDQRVEGTLATSVIGVMKGCSFVRVHDVKENRRVIQMTEAILGCN